MTRRKAWLLTALHCSRRVLGDDLPLVVDDDEALGIEIEHHAEVGIERRDHVGELLESETQGEAYVRNAERENALPLAAFQTARASAALNAEAEK